MPLPAVLLAAGAAIGRVAASAGAAGARAGAGAAARAGGAAARTEVSAAASTPMRTARGAFDAYNVVHPQVGSNYEPRRSNFDSGQFSGGPDVTSSMDYEQPSGLQ